MSKLAIVSVGLSAVILTVIIPVLEVNTTHLMNPDWPSHARLHEAWQLLTNAAISMFALGCVWTGRAPRIGISLDLMIWLSFLVAWILAFAYGGSMQHSDGTQMAVVDGFNFVVMVMITLTALLVESLWKTRQPNISQQRGVRA